MTSNVKREFCGTCGRYLETKGTFPRCDVCGSIFCHDCGLSKERAEEMRTTEETPVPFVSQMFIALLWDMVDNPGGTVHGVGRYIPVSKEGGCPVCRQKRHH